MVILPREIIGKIFYIVKSELSATKIQRSWRRIYCRRTIIYKQVINIFENVNYGFKYYYNRHIEFDALKCIYRLFCKKFKRDYYLKNHFVVYFNNLLNLHLLSKTIIRKIWEYEIIYYRLYNELIIRNNHTYLYDVMDV